MQVLALFEVTADEKGAAHLANGLGVLADSGPCSGRSAWNFSGQDSGKVP